MWERKLPIVIPLVGLGLAHWALLFRGMFIITAAYDPTTLSCVVTTTKHVFLSVTFWASRCLILPARLLWFSPCSSSSASVGVVLIWLSVYFAAMGFNLIILVLHVVGLLRGDNSASISELLFKDGVIFYLGAFSCNALPAVSGSAIEPHAYIKRKTPFLHRSSTPLI